MFTELGDKVLAKNIVWVSLNLNISSICNIICEEKIEYVFKNSLKKNNELMFFRRKYMNSILPTFQAYENRAIFILENPTIIFNKHVVNVSGLAKYCEDNTSFTNFEDAKFVCFGNDDKYTNTLSCLFSDKNDVIFFIDQIEN